MVQQLPSRNVAFMNSNTIHTPLVSLDKYGRPKDLLHGSEHFDYVPTCAIPQEDHGDADYPQDTMLNQVFQKNLVRPKFCHLRDKNSNI